MISWIPNGVKSGFKSVGEVVKIVIIISKFGVDSLLTHF